MNSIEDWFSIHALEHDIVFDALNTPIAALLQQFSHNSRRYKPGMDGTNALKDSGHCVDLVRQAFNDYFANHEESDYNLQAIEFAFRPEKVTPAPYTLDRGQGEKPLIEMMWGGKPEDLICLAHEMAHALQILSSRHDFMPPVARETCAFLGELILIDWAQKQDEALFGALLDVWDRENKCYLGSDLTELRKAIDVPNGPYHYRLNYPIARLVASYIFQSKSRDDVLTLLKSGGRAMDHLPLGAIANKTADIHNYLPPMPARDMEQSAVNAYRELGTIALLDIDFWRGESEKRIEDYYANALAHMQERRVFIALGEGRKPLGYATWSCFDDPQRIVLTRQAAPFGDHLALQMSLEKHLKTAQIVSAHHQRSARQEQTAW